MHDLVYKLVRIQGGYYLLTGIWSLVHRRSFEAITGPKHEYWLVQSVDLRHGLPGNISRVYALDGVLQLILAAAAAKPLLRERGRACAD
jgi:hypothetical protein